MCRSSDDDIYVAQTLVDLHVFADAESETLALEGKKKMAEERGEGEQAHGCRKRRRRRISVEIANERPPSKRGKK